MTKSKELNGKDEKASVATRRDLVTIVRKAEDERPYHIHAKSNGALIARLADESKIDGFLERLDISVFHRE